MFVNLFVDLRLGLMVFSSVPIQFRSSSLLSLPFRAIAFQFHIVSSHFQSAAILRPRGSFPSFSDANQFCTSHIRVSSFQIHSFPCPFYSLTIRSDSYRVISFPMLRKRSRSYPIRIKSIPCRFMLRQSNLFPFRSFPLHSSSDRSLHWLFWTVRHVAHAIKILALPWQFMAVRRISLSRHI